MVIFVSQVHVGTKSTEGEDAVETEREASGFGFVAAPETKMHVLVKSTCRCIVTFIKTDGSGERFPPETTCDVHGRVLKKQTKQGFLELNQRQVMGAWLSGVMSH